MPNETQVAAGLRYLERTLRSASELTASAAAVRPVVVLLHGFGASAGDLVDLAAALDDVVGAERWVFPHAPVPIEVAGMSYGRAWFPRDPHSLHAALYGDYFQDLRTIETPDVALAAEAVRGLMAALGVVWSRVILGGFSQGAIVTAEVLRQAVAGVGETPRAALLFSGALIGQRTWEQSVGPHAPIAAKTPVFQSHGRADTVLHFEQAVALRAAVERCGYTVSFHEFTGGHTIDQSTLHAARSFLSGHLQSPGAVEKR